MKLKTKEMVICALFSGIISILSQISIPIPFTSVPLTMQIFAVALSGIILGSKKAFISNLIYILMGAIGIPVFAQFTGGLSIIFGPTGGFILGFPVMAFIIGYISEKFSSNKFLVMGMISGLLIDYLIGTLMFVFVAKVTFTQGLMSCVIPFIPIDLIKIALANIVGINILKRSDIKAKLC